jgi:hypothetical protein
LLVEIRRSERRDPAAIARDPDESGRCWNILDRYDLSVAARVG